ncbi:MAG: flippase [Methanosarcinaceae archaeon]|nr:flippase [Methanosarcinaceae archaeon]
MFNFKFRKTMRSVQWSFISLATAAFSHMLLRMILGRTLGPSGLGVYSLVFTIYLFGMQFAGFGIGSGLTRYVAEFKDEDHKVKEYVSSGFFGTLINGLIVTVALYLVSDFIARSVFHNVEMGKLIKITAFCLPFISIQKMVLGTLNGLHRMKSYAIITIIQNGLVLFLSVYFVLVLNTEVKGAILGLVISTIITGLISIVFIKEFISAFSFSFSKAFKDLIWYGYYTVLADSIGMVNTQIDSLMLGHFLNAEIVGYYAVAIIFVNGLALIPNSVHIAVAPYIAYFYGKGEYEKTAKFIKKIILYMAILIIFISILLIFFGKTLIIFLFKKEFLLAYFPLLILLIGKIIYLPIHAVDCAIPNIGKVNIMYKIALSTAIFNVIFNIILIPKYEIMGAALATSISLIILSLLKLYIIDKYIFKFRDVGEKI